MVKLFEQLPRIIGEAAKSPRGILALAIAVLSIIGFLFFDEAPVEVRIGIFALMFGGFAGFVLLAFTRYRPSEPSAGKTDEIRPSEQNEKGGLRAKGDEKLEDAEELRLSGRNDQARSAYEEARTLYKHEQNRLGEANVLSGLGGLEAKTEPELAKQHLYQAANIYESIGLEDQKRTALEEAAKLGR